MEDQDQPLETWLKQSVDAKIASSTSSVTVTLMTEKDFKESWELPPSVCISYLGDRSGVVFEMLAYEGREIKGSTDVALGTAVGYLLSFFSTKQECLYLWPGDQSQGFEGYPTDVPLPGPFPQERLAKILSRLGQVLIEQRSKS